MVACGLFVTLLFLAVSPQTRPQTQPRLPIHVESLNHPPLGRQAHMVGDAVLIAQIGSDGRVSIPILKSGHPLFLQAAEDNLTKWKFQSGEDQQMEVTYHFTIIEPSSNSAQTECAFDLSNSVTILTHLPPERVLYSTPTGKPLPK
jgi:hypothetical protein